MEIIKQESIINFMNYLELPRVFIQQKKELTEILINWETKNKYVLEDDKKQTLGFIKEEAGGFTGHMLRFFLRSHRPLKIQILNHDGQLNFVLTRPFFWFFSTLTLCDSQQKKIGVVERRFSFFSKKYEIFDHFHSFIAKVHSPIWKIWQFPIKDKMDHQVGLIAKKWGGFLKESFTDADRFMVEYGVAESWPKEKKALLLAAAISIDFDFFENNDS
jgi:uncharacterized protein YxjI